MEYIISTWTKYSKDKRMFALAYLSPQTSLHTLQFNGNHCHCVHSGVKINPKAFEAFLTEVTHHKEWDEEYPVGSLLVHSKKYNNSSF